MPTVMVRYVAGAFVDASTLAPTAQDVTELLLQLGDNELLPSMVNTLSSIGLGQRLTFQSADGLRYLLLGPNRFDVAHHAPLPLVHGLEDFRQFCLDARQMLGVVLEHFHRTPHRLVSVREGLDRDRTDQQKEDIANRLLRVPQLFVENRPFEWDWRCASHTRHDVGDESEEFNYIVTVKRATATLQGLNPVSSFPVNDCIYFEFDVNTAPGNTRERFTPDRVTSFFEQAPRWQEELLNSVRDLIEVNHANA
jgi:hypothetical protein